MMKCCSENMPNFSNIASCLNFSWAWKLTKQRKPYWIYNAKPQQAIHTFDSSKHVGASNAVQKHNRQQKNVRKPFARPTAEQFVEIEDASFAQIKTGFGEIFEAFKLLGHEFAGFSGCVKGVGGGEAVWIWRSRWPLGSTTTELWHSSLTAAQVRGDWWIQAFLVQRGRDAQSNFGLYFWSLSLGHG